jgi:hypothetical protein
MYLKPSKPGYYWYRKSLEWNDGWDIVKVNIFSDGAHPSPKTELRFQIFGWQNLDSVAESEGIWGEKVADLHEVQVEGGQDV